MHKFAPSASVPIENQWITNSAMMARTILDTREVISMLQTNNPTFWSVHQSLMTLIVVAQVPLGLPRSTEE